MRLYYIYILLFFLTSINFNAIATNNNSYSGLVKSNLENYNLINSDNSINHHLLELIKIYGYKSNDKNIDSINDFMQQNFIRPKGKERRDLVDTHNDKVRRTKVIQLLKKMGFVDEIPYLDVRSRI